MSGRHTPIGVDVGGRCLKAAQLVRVGGGARGGWALGGATVLDRAAPGDALGSGDVARLADVLDRQGFRGARVVLSAPSGRVMTSVIELPSRKSGAPLDQLARVEMARAHKRDPGSFSMSFWELPQPARATEGTHVMAAACANADAEALLDLFEARGLEVVGLDVGSWAMARACAPLTSPDGLSALLDIGWDSGTLVLVQRGVVVYERRLMDAGIRTLHGELMSRLGVEAEVAEFAVREIGMGATEAEGHADWELAPDARAAVRAHGESLVGELKASMSYAGHRYGGTVDRLVLAGGGGGIAGMAELLGSLVAVPAVAATPNAVSVRADATRAECRSAVLAGAIGLAMYSEAQAA